MVRSDLDCRFRFLYEATSWRYSFLRYGPWLFSASCASAAACCGLNSPILPRPAS